MNWKAYWEHFNSPAESLRRQEEAERKAVEGVCVTCGARTIDRRCVLCGEIQ